MHTIEEKAQILLDNLDKKTDGKPHDIYQDIAHCALDIICGKDADFPSWTIT